MFDWKHTLLFRPPIDHTLIWSASCDPIIGSAIECECFGLILFFKKSLMSIKRIKKSRSSLEAVSNWDVLSVVPAAEYLPLCSWRLVSSLNPTNTESSHLPRFQRIRQGFAISYIRVVPAMSSDWQPVVHAAACAASARALCKACRFKSFIL